MVPANFIRILEAPWQDYDLTSVKRILHAAAPCPTTVKRRIMDVFPPGTGLGVLRRRAKAWAP